MVSDYNTQSTEDSKSVTPVLDETGDDYIQQLRQQTRRDKALDHKQANTMLGESRKTTTTLLTTNQQLLALDITSVFIESDDGSDSDVANAEEADKKYTTRQQTSLRDEAKYGYQLLTHKPRNLYCDACVRAKL